MRWYRHIGYWLAIAFCSLLLGANIALMGIAVVSPEYGFSPVKWLERVVNSGIWVAGIYVFFTGWWDADPVRKSQHKLKVNQRKWWRKYGDRKWPWATVRRREQPGR